MLLFLLGEAMTGKIEISTSHRNIAERPVEVNYISGMVAKNSRRLQENRALDGCL